MKTRIIKSVSRFLKHIIQVIYTFVLTIFFWVKYFINLAWEIIMTIFNKMDGLEREDTEFLEFLEPLPKFSIVWRMLDQKNSKDMNKIILKSAKDSAHQMNKRFWKDLEKILPVALTALVLLLIFILLIALKIPIGVWLLLIGFILYFIFLILIRELLKKFLE